MRKRKVRVKKGGRRLLIVLLCLVVIAIIALDYSNFSFKKEEKITPKEEKKEEVKKEPKYYEAHLFMVGDALIHSDVYQDAKQADGTYDFKPMLELIKPISSQYDLVYYNQETILGGTELGLSNYPRFNSPYEVGDAFIDAGFNMVSLATNHTMDKNEAGVINSVNYWSQHKDNVVYSGQWTSFDIYPVGWDKTFCLQFINGYDNILFFGDNTYPGGGDYDIAINKKITKAIDVKGPDDTIKKVNQLLEEIESL